MKNIRTTAPLTEHQASVMRAFRPDEDTPISDIFAEVYGPAASSTREMQQKLAPTFSEINKKLIPPQRIKPGKIKQTYRYSTIAKG